MTTDLIELKEITTLKYTRGNLLMSNEQFNFLGGVEFWLRSFLQFYGSLANTLRERIVFLWLILRYHAGKAALIISILYLLEVSFGYKIEGT